MFVVFFIITIKKPEDGKGGAGGIDPFRLTMQEEDMIAAMRGAMSCVVDKKTSLITISVTDCDPQVAAIIADTLQLRLQKYITDYRTKKARNDVAFYEKLYSETKIAYQDAQRRYASFADSNAEMVLHSFIAKREELENDMQMKGNLYTQMATQLQSAKAKVQERTPAFIVIQGATVPNMASSTSRTFIVIIFIMLSIAVGSVWVLFKSKR